MRSRKRCANTGPCVSRVWSTAPGTQLLCLTVYLSNRELAREAAAAWSDLSRARHHHPYELAPTANELRDLLDIAHRFAAEVARQAASHRSRSG